MILEVSLSLSLCVSLYSISISMNRETPTVKEFFNLHGSPCRIPNSFVSEAVEKPCRVYSVWMCMECPNLPATIERPKTWSIGVITFLLLSGKHPFTGKTVEQVRPS